MPAVMPRISRSSPRASRETRARASSKATSVKTAMRSEREHVPQPLAGHAVARGGGGVARGVGGNHLVGGRALAAIGLLRLHDDALGLAAHAQLLDAGAVVLDHRFFHL